MLPHCVGGSRRKENSDGDCHTRKAGLFHQSMDYTPCCFAKFGSSQLVSGIWSKGMLNAHWLLLLLLMLLFSFSCIKVSFVITSMLDLFDGLRR